MPRSPPAPAGGAAGSSQGSSRGQALPADRVKASRMLHCRTDLGRSSGGTDASRQAAAPAAGGCKPGGGQQPSNSRGSKPGGGQQPRSSGTGKENQAAAANKGAGSGQQPRCSGAGKENQAVAANKGAGSDQQPCGSGTGKVNQATAANKGAARGEGAGGKVGSAGVEKRKGGAGLGEPAGRDLQPNKRAEKRKGGAGIAELAGKDAQPKKQRAPAPKRSEWLRACCTPGVKTRCIAGSSRSTHHQGDAIALCH